MTGRRLIFGMVAAGLALSCASNAKTPQREITWKRFEGGVTRFIDHDAGVLCYIINGGGLWCTPLPNLSIEAHTRLGLR